MILEQCPGCVGISDDVAVSGNDDADHDKKLYNLMTVADEEGLSFNYDKCDFKVPKIQFYGNVYSAEGVSPDPERVEAIAQIPSPMNKRELQEFMGIATYIAICTQAVAPGGTSKRTPQAGYRV